VFEKLLLPWTSSIIHMSVCNVKSSKYTKGMRRIMSRVACVTAPYFFILSQTALLGGGLNVNVCFDFLYNFCLKDFLFQKELSEMLSDMYSTYVFM
jgi:hypothetical protein